MPDVPAVTVASLMVIVRRAVVIENRTDSLRCARSRTHRREIDHEVSVDSRFVSPITGTVMVRESVPGLKRQGAAGRRVVVVGNRSRYWRESPSCRRPSQIAR